MGTEEKLTRPYLGRFKMSYTRIAIVVLGFIALSSASITFDKEFVKWARTPAGKSIIKNLLTKNKDVIVKAYEFRKTNPAPKENLMEDVEDFLETTNPTLKARIASMLEKHGMDVTYGPSFMVDVAVRLLHQPVEIEKKIETRGAAAIIKSLYPKAKLEALKLV